MTGWIMDVSIKGAMLLSVSLCRTPSVEHYLTYSILYDRGPDLHGIQKVSIIYVVQNTVFGNFT